MRNFYASKIFQGVPAKFRSKPPPKFYLFLNKICRDRHPVFSPPFSGQAYQIGVKRNSGVMNKGPVHYNSSSIVIRRRSPICCIAPFNQNITLSNFNSFPGLRCASSPLRYSSSAVRSVSSPAKMCCEIAKTSSEAAKMLSEEAKTSSDVTNISSEVATMNKNVTKMSSEPSKMCCEMAKTFSEAAKIPFDPQKPDFLSIISNKVTNEHKIHVINEHKSQTPNVYKTFGAFL